MKELVYIEATKVPSNYVVWNIGPDHTPEGCVIFVALIPGTYTIDQEKVAIKVSCSDTDRSFLLYAASYGIGNYHQARRCLHFWGEKEPKGYLAKKKKHAAELTIDFYREVL